MNTQNVIWGPGPLHCPRSKSHRNADLNRSTFEPQYASKVNL